MYLEGIIVCVNYSDFLSHTLPFNKPLFNHLIVVTSPEDEKTKNLCEYYNVECVVTNEFTKNGDAFNKAKEVSFTPELWSKLENTESIEIKKGEWKKAEEVAKKYDKTPPSVLKKSLLKGDYGRPMILKFGDRYHLVAGNTRLCTAAAMGMTPKVLIAEV